MSWPNWDSDMHDEVKTQEETTIIGQVRHFCSRIIWLLVPLNINHEDDGTSFNNMADIDTIEHFAFNDPSSPLSKEARRVICFTIKIIFKVYIFINDFGISLIHLNTNHIFSR